MRPVWLRALELARENGVLRRDLATVRLEKARLLRQVEVLSDKLHRTRQDADLIALMARDRNAALEVIRTQHEISDLPEIGGVA